VAVNCGSVANRSERVHAGNALLVRAPASLPIPQSWDTENEILLVDNPLHAEYATPTGPFFELTWRSVCHHFLPDRSEHQAAYNPSSEYGFVAVSVPVEGAVRELIRLTELEEIAYEK